MIRCFLAMAFLAFGLVFTAQADTRSLYTVTDIDVNEVATNVIEAQQNAFAAARRVAAQRMIERITLAEDRAERGSIQLTMAEAQRLAAAVDVQEESRGGGRYVATLSVVLNPVAVRSYLRDLDVPFIDTQAPTALLVPISRNAVLGEWYAAWGEANAGALAPYVTAQSAYPADVTWEDIQGEVGISRARRGIIAELDGGPGSYTVRVSTLTASSQSELGRTQRAATIEQAAEAASRLADLAWKRQSIVRSGARTISEATVLYTSLPEWNTLRGALPRSPLVSDFQIKAVSSDGAVVEFAFAGDTDRLMADLRQRGVALEFTPVGWVMRSAVSGVQ